MPNKAHNQAATSGSPPPAFRPAPPGISFAEFEPLSPDDVAAAVARLPDKSSAVDPIPVTVLKNVACRRSAHAISDAIIQPFVGYWLCPRMFQGFVCDADLEEIWTGRG